MKKFLALLLAVAMTAGISVAGTVAYLTSEDSDVNVMTVGRAKISQTEWQRAEGVASDAEASKDADTLVPFVQGQPLLPAVPVNGAATDYTAAPGASGDESTMTEMFKWGDYTSATLDGNGLWYDSKLKNTMDKFVFVENTGSVDVYFRTIIAYECPEGLTFGDAVRDSIGANVNGAYDWEGIGYMTIDNVRYAVSVGTYNDPRLNGEILKPGETARPSLLQVAMNHEMGNDEVAKLGDTYEILVLSQAVQAAGFETAADALKEAFGDVTAENAAAWFSGTAIPAVVTTVADMKAALDAGETNVVVKGAAITENPFNGHYYIDRDIAFVDCTFTANMNYMYINNATFTNCTFDCGSANSAVHYDELFGDLVFNDCTFTSGKIQIGVNKEVTGTVTFNDCEFAETTSDSIWSEKGIRVYSPAEFNNCEFNNRVVLSGSNGLAITFNGCTMNGGTPVYYTDNTDGIIRGGNVPAVTINN